MSDSSLLETSEIKLNTLEPKGTGYGVGKSLRDQQALPINPANSITLKVHSMVIRNEITSRLLSGGRIPVVGANRMQRVGKIESEANALL